MAAPPLGSADGWIPRPRYRDDRHNYRNTLCHMILDAVALGVKIPDDMPVDSEEHIQSAIVFVARLTGQHARKTNMPLW